MARAMFQTNDRHDVEIRRKCAGTSTIVTSRAGGKLRKKERAQARAQCETKQKKGGVRNALTHRAPKTARNG